MKFLSVRIRGNELTLAGVVKEDLACSGSSPLKKKGGPLPKVYKRTSPQALKLSSLTMKQYPLLWDFIRLNRKDI
jgi:hypothetical protein